MLLVLISSLVLASSAQAQQPTTATVPVTPPARGDGTATAGASDTAGAMKGAKVDFLAPKDGETVGKTFTMKFHVEGLKVSPAGEITPGSGHFHVIVDGPAVKKGDVIPADTTHIHYGKGQMEAPLTLAPGNHTLTLQFADGAHRAYDAMLEKTIHIHVK